MTYEQDFTENNLVGRPPFRYLTIKHNLNVKFILYSVWYPTERSEADFGDASLAYNISNAEIVDVNTFRLNFGAIGNAISGTWHIKVMA